VLSEEAPDPRARLRARRVWIIDPLDGTREFAEPGRRDWAVHVALWQDGDLAVAAVHLPAEGLCFSTADPPRPPAGRPERIRIAVSRNRAPAWVTELAAGLGAQLLPMGSAGAKCAAVWRGQADAYVHAGGQHEWDSAAPVAVARAAGLHASRLDGAELAYNQADTWLPDLLVCRPELVEPILARLPPDPGGPDEPVPGAT
jgi:3'(2'), 5'-bisphosphate nucleotidase